MPGILNELAVTSAGDNNITVNTGRALADNTVYNNSASLSKTTNSPVVGTTGRRCTLQKDWGSRTVRVGISSSPDGVAALPALVQIDGVGWEIPLASFTITTGGVIGALTDERYLVPPFNRRKASDETVNNSDTLQDDDDFQFEAEADVTYIIEAQARVSWPKTPNFKSAFVVPSGATISGWMATHNPVSGTDSSADVAATADWTSALAIGSGTFGAAAAMKLFAVLVMGGTAGKVKFQWAQNVATVADTTVEQDSFITVRRL